MRSIVLSCATLIALLGCDNSSPSAAKPAESSGKSEAKQAAAKHPWAGFKPGSYAKLKTTTEMEIGGNKNKSETEMKQTLLELNDKEAVVEMEMSVAGTVQKNKMNMPLKGPEGKAADGPKPKTGSEEIKVGGKSYKCTWIEMDTEANGNKTNTKVWSCEDVPGFTVKSVSKTTGTMSMETTTELVESASK